MAYQTFSQEYFQIPPVTRAYTTACVLTTLAVQLEVVSPFQLYFNPILIWRNFQVWRIFTTFFFFGTIGFNFFFNMIFTYRYCRMLEEGSFRGRTADFVYMFIFGGAILVFLGIFVNLLFLGQALTIMLVYIWSRRNPFIRMNFFGLLNFQAPYLPWVLLAFSVLLGNSIVVDVLGMAVGHCYFFLEDVYPNAPGGFRILKTPLLLKIVLDPPDEVETDPRMIDNYANLSQTPEALAAAAAAAAALEREEEEEENAQGDLSDSSLRQRRQNEMDANNEIGAS